MGFEDPCEVLGQRTGPQGYGSQSLSLAPSLRYILLSGSVNPGREIARGFHFCPGLLI